MNLSQAKEYLPFVQAAAEGKIIQFRSKSNDNWYDSDNLSFTDDYCYRIKPSPTYRPWKPEEVPVGALLRKKDAKHFDVFLITGRTMFEGIAYIYAEPWFNGNEPVTSERMMQFEHSIDNGKTWLPCFLVVF